MKITDQDIIKSGEKELIDAITGDLDWTAIEQVFRDKYNLGLQEDVEYKQGDIVIHNNKIAYRLDFDVKVKVSVLFDRKGEYLDLRARDQTDNALVAEAHEHDDEAILPREHLDNEPDFHSVSEINSANDIDEEMNDNVSQMATQIADMISEINQD